MSFTEGALWRAVYYFCPWIEDIKQFSSISTEEAVKSAALQIFKDDLTSYYKSHCYIMSESVIRDALEEFGTEEELTYGSCEGYRGT